MGEASLDVVYGDAGSRPLKMDIYRPDKPNGAAVLLIHGGGWRGGSKDMLAPHAKHLNDAGYLAASTEYRLTPESHYPASIHDVKRAIRYLKSNAGKLGFDADKLAAEGHSAGAHLALLAAGTANDKRLDPPDADHSVSASIAAVAAVYPPTIIYPGEARVSGGSPGTALKGAAISAEEAELASPITHVTKDFPPAMLLHGDADKTVPITASLNFDKAMRAAGARCDLHVFAGLPHGFAGHEQIRPMMMNMIIVFFNRFVAVPEKFLFATPQRAAAPAR
jgi:acetyl esterase/lipase